jgi:diphthamide synthase subunit DPH2
MLTPTATAVRVVAIKRSELHIAFGCTLLRPLQEVDRKRQEVGRKSYTFVGSGEDKLHFSCRHTEKNVFLYDVKRTNYTVVGNRQKKLYFCRLQRRKSIFL